MGDRTLIGWAALVAIAALATGCGGSGGGDGGGGMMPGPSRALDGEYQIAVEALMDDCDFGIKPSSTPIRVIEGRDDKASVNIPIGGAGGSCAPGQFDRAGHILSRTLLTQQSVGMCEVDALSETLLEFFDDGSVTGSENITLTAISGDCSAFGLACTTELSLNGNACSGCFDCVESPITDLPETGLGMAFGRIP